MAAITNEGGPNAAQSCDAAVWLMMRELRRLEPVEPPTPGDSVETESGPR